MTQTRSFCLKAMLIEVKPAKAALQCLTFLLILFRLVGSKGSSPEKGLEVAGIEPKVSPSRAQSSNHLAATLDCLIYAL